jgi:hypothetical protein
MKPKTGKFKDTLLEVMKRQFAGHVQEVNRVLMPLSENYLLKLAEYMGIYPKIQR